MIKCVIKNMFAVIAIGILFLTSCTTFEDPIKNKIVKLLNEPEQIVEFMLDSSLTASETRLLIKEGIENRKNERKEIKENAIKMFKGKVINISVDTVLKSYSCRYSKFDSVRIIGIRAEENEYFFYFVYEDNKWKLYDYNKYLPYEFQYPYVVLKNNFQIIDSMITNPESIWKYSENWINSYKNQSVDKKVFENIPINIIKNAICYIKHNYKDGYVLDLHEFTASVDDEHHIYIINKHFKRPLDIEFSYNDSLKKFELTNFWFYGVPRHKASTLYRYSPDSLTFHELESNWKLTDKILTNPEILYDIFTDTNLVNLSYFMQEAIKNGFIERLILYINDNFKVNCMVEYDFSDPDINPHFMPSGFDNWHYIKLVNESNGKTLKFVFSDNCGNLYKFRLVSLFTSINEVDGINWDNIHEATP